MSYVMVNVVDTGGLARNIGIYLFGVGMAVAGALGLAEAIELSVVLSGVLFVGGLSAVVFVHEYLGGPF